MASTTARHSVALVAVIALGACTTPDVSVEVARGSATTVEMTMCPVGAMVGIGSSGCAPPVDLFPGAATTVHEDIFIDNAATRFSLAFAVTTTAGATCTVVAIDIATHVALAFDAGTAAFTCAPMACSVDTAAQCRL